MSTDDLKRPPQFPRLPWFPRDFASATRGWPLVARAVYRELLDCQWDMGELPNDEDVLRRMVDATRDEWEIAWPIVRAKFVLSDDGTLRNARLEQHRAQAVELWRRRSAGAWKTNQKRWGSVAPIGIGDKR